MDDLILAVLSGEATPQERRALERWRNESPENERAFQEFVRTWDVIPLFESPEPISAPPALESVVAAGDRRRRRAIPLSIGRTKQKKYWNWLAAAAVAAFMIFGMPLLREGPPVSLVATGPAETRTVSFEDGTVIRIGPNSVLETWSDDSRRARLDGIGFFAVASDSTKPYLIRTKAGRAEVLGTRFEVSTVGDSLRLVVVEGTVRLSASGEAVEVPSGAMSSIAAGAPPTTPTEVDAWNMLEWEAGLLIFQDTPLEDVVSEIGAFFGVTINIRDIALMGRLVTAWFEDESFEDVIGTICEVVGARCVVDETVEMSS